jgi:hypothetical protein
VSDYINHRGLIGIYTMKIVELQRKCFYKVEIFKDWKYVLILVLNFLFKILCGSTFKYLDLLSM